METRVAGTDTYVATEDLMMAVNAAVNLTRPLPVKGEPVISGLSLCGMAESRRRIQLALHPIDTDDSSVA